MANGQNALLGMAVAATLTACGGGGDKPYNPNALTPIDSSTIASVTVGGQPVTITSGGKISLPANWVNAPQTVQVTLIAPVVVPPIVEFTADNNMPLATLSATGTCTPAPNTPVGTVAGTVFDCTITPTDLSYASSVPSATGGAAASSTAYAQTETICFHLSIPAFAQTALLQATQLTSHGLARFGATVSGVLTAMTPTSVNAASATSATLPLAALPQGQNYQFSQVDANGVPVAPSATTPALSLLANPNGTQILQVNAPASYAGAPVYVNVDKVLTASGKVLEAQTLTVNGLFAPAPLPASFDALVLANAPAGALFASQATIDLTKNLPVGVTITSVALAGSATSPTPVPAALLQQPTTSKSIVTTIDITGKIVTIALPVGSGSTYTIDVTFMGSDGVARTTTISKGS
jgi:hypothetical protein